MDPRRWGGLQRVRLLLLCAAVAAILFLLAHEVHAHHDADGLRSKQLHAASMERLSRHAERWPRVRHWRTVRVTIKRQRIRALRVHRGCSAGGTVVRNLRLGRCMAARSPYRWVSVQWGCLRVLWHKESRWRHWARNPSSGAFGIVQSLPKSKLYSAGRAIHTARVQIRWGLRYVKRRYGSPCAALSFHRRMNWY